MEWRGPAGSILQVFFNASALRVQVNGDVFLAGLVHPVNGVWQTLSVVVDTQSLLVWSSRVLVLDASLSHSLVASTGSSLTVGRATASVLVVPASARLITARAFGEDLTAWDLLSAASMSPAARLLLQDVVELDGVSAKLTLGHVPPIGEQMSLAITCRLIFQRFCGAAMGRGESGRRGVPGAPTRWKHWLSKGAIIALPI